MKILFACSENINRSKTAEALFKGRFDTKSAGFFCEKTESTTPISEELLEWADVICVFEEAHLKELERRFPTAYRRAKIANLEIFDMYKFMSPTLKEYLEWKLPECLAALEKKRIVRHHEIERNQPLA